MIQIQLLYNLSVLVALSVLSTFIDSKFDRRRISGKIVQGILFGLTAIIGMMYPLVITKGLIFDGRTVVISLVTIFFGSISGGIAASFAFFYRLSIGGPGVIMGVTTIIEAYLVGLIFYNYNKRKKINTSNFQLYSMGMIVHIIMLALIFTLPKDRIISTFKNISVSLITIYPVMTVVIGRILLDNLQNREYLRRLKESENFFRSIIYSIKDAVIITDNSGVVQTINQAAKELFNCIDDEYIGKKVSEVFKGKSNVISINFNFLIKNSYSFIQEFIADNYKKYFYITASSIHNDNNEDVGSVFVIKDITELKEKEAELLELNEKFDFLFNTMNEIVTINKLVFNEQGEPVNYRIIDCNRSFLKFIDKKREDVIGKTITEIYNQKEALYLKEFSTVVKTGEPVTFNIYYESLNKHFFVSAFVFKKDFFVTISLDITKIKQYEEKLIKKDKELEEYLYATSHDLRAPLVNIQGFTDLLRDYFKKIKDYFSFYELKGEDGKKIKRIFEEDAPGSFNYINESTKKLDSLITGILKISKAEKKIMVVDKIDMNRLLDEILLNNKYRLDEISATVIKKSLPYCYGDRELIMSLFSNLIDNAIKYRDKNRDLKITISAIENDNTVIYSIKDNGKGISKSYIDKIWNIYYRVAPAMASDGEGIGLALVKRIVERHKGKVSVKSKEGSGSTFFVELKKVKFKVEDI